MLTSFDDPAAAPNMTLPLTLPFEPRSALAQPDARSPGVAPEFEEAFAGVLLRLLLDDAWQPDELAQWDWDLLLRLGLPNRILLRSAERLVRRGIGIPPAVAGAIASERRRVRGMLELAGKVTRVCRAHDIKFVIAKAFGHLPDLGTDLDVIALVEPARFHRVLAAELNATRRKERFDRWLAGRVVYTTADAAGPLDLHFGRLGHGGEHVTAARRIVARAETVVVDGTEMVVPQPEDRLLLQVMHRMYGGYALRIADVVVGTRILCMPELDWPYVTATAKRDGILHGLAAYVHFIGEIHAQTTGRRLDGFRHMPALPPGPWGDVRFRRGLYRFPALRLNTTLYMRALADRMLTSDWRETLRLGIATIVAWAPHLRQQGRRARAC